MFLIDLTPGDDLKIKSTGIQYKYDGYKNYHRMGWMHWVIKDGIKTAYSYKTEVEKIT